MRSVLVGIAAFGLLLGAPGLTPNPDAQTPTVDFWLPAETIIDPATEEIVVFQGPVTTTWLEPNCGVPAPGDYPMQSAVAASRLFGVIVLTEVAPQTRLGNINFVGSCFVGGVRYHRFVGAVQ